MDRLLRMDKDRFVEEMLAEVRLALGQVADAVKDAPSGPHPTSMCSGFRQSMPE